MFDNVGSAASSGITTSLLVCVSVIPTILLHWQGQKWRLGKEKVNFVPGVV